MVKACCEAQRSPVLSGLFQRRADFVAFVAGRLGDRTQAEDIVQSSFVKASERIDQLQGDESATAWFYRMLRNAVLDQRRRQASSRRATDRFLAEQVEVVAAIEREPRPCRCVSKLLDGLKPEYAEALRRVEIDETSVKDFATEQGTSANNAGVRIFRARAALRREVVATCGACCKAGGCFDCTCPDSC